MRVVLKNNCFPNDIIKINGMPVLFDANSEAIVEVYNTSFRLELIHGEASIPFDEFENETLFEKSHLVDKAMKKGLKWVLQEAEKMYNDMSLLVDCTYEISGYVDREYIILEKDLQEPKNIFGKFFIEDFNYVYMYPFIVNAKGKILSCEGANADRVVKSQRKQYVADNAFISGIFDMLIEVPIHSAFVKNYCKDNKAFKVISKALESKSGF